MELGVGSVVDGRYSLERELRRTATRVTFLARHLHVDKMYEVDVLLGKAPDTIASFQAEARADATAEDFGQTEAGDIYLVHRTG